MLILAFYRMHVGDVVAMLFVFVNPLNRPVKLPSSMNYSWMWTLIACSLGQGSSTSIAKEIPTATKQS